MKTYLLTAVVAGLFAASSAMAVEFPALGDASGKVMAEAEMAKVEGGNFQVNVNALNGGGAAAISTQTLTAFSSNKSKAVNIAPVYQSNKCFAPFSGGC
jgi:hypothetical protein